MTGLTHFNQDGEAHMVDIGGKASSRRVAIASGRILMHSETLDLIEGGGHKKGDVLGIARVAAIMASKKTADLVPLCHPLQLTHVDIRFVPERDGETAVRCVAQVETGGRTGVEMEALCAVQVGLLTIYDMCKAVDRGMVLSDVRLERKTGGKSGDWVRDDESH